MRLFDSTPLGGFGKAWPRAAGMLALAWALTLGAGSSMGCSRRTPAPPYSAEGVRVMSAQTNPTLTRFYAQAFAELGARRQLKRGLLLADPSLAAMARTDEFIRAAVDAEIRQARIVEISYEPEARKSRVVVAVKPEKFHANIAEAISIRRAQTNGVFPIEKNEELYSEEDLDAASRAPESLPPAETPFSGSTVEADFEDAPAGEPVILRPEISR
jgi:hypothetical protein